MIREIEPILARTRPLFAEPDRPRALIQVKSVGGIALPKMPPLNSFVFPRDTIPYLDLRGQRELAYWQARATLDDDLIPSIAPWYGIAEHTAFLGGEVELSETTSYNHVILPDWADFDKLKLDPDNAWLKMVVDGISHYKATLGDEITARQRGADGPSDIANIVRGNDLFYDLYDEPELVKKLASFCAEAIRFTIERQKAASGPVAEGYLTGFEIWMPGNAIGHLSEDASCMMSPDSYEELFFDALKQTVAGYDNAMLHTHSLGRVMLPFFAQVPQISVIELSSDPNAPRAVEVWREYRQTLRDKIVVTSPTLAELRENRDLFAESRCIVWYDAKDLSDAREAVEWVRALHS